MGNLIGWHSLKSTLVGDSYVVDIVWYSGATADPDASFAVGNNVRLALEDLTGTNYRGLSVVLDIAPGASNTTVLKLKRIAITESGEGYCLQVADTSGSDVPDKAIVLEGTHLAVNAAGDLILVDSGYDVSDAEDNAWVSLGDKGLRAVLISGKWYLVVST